MKTILKTALTVLAVSAQQENMEYFTEGAGTSQPYGGRRQDEGIGGIMDLFFRQHEELIGKLGFKHVREQAKQTYELLTMDSETRRRQNTLHT